jgi:hypothetical protein
MGCLGCLGNKDWAVRKAAAETLLALCRMLGPEIENGAVQDRKRVPRVVDYLRAIKHDRVKPTREQFTITLAAFEELQTWMDEHSVCCFVNCL